MDALSQSWMSWSCSLQLYRQCKAGWAAMQIRLHFYGGVLPLPRLDSSKNCFKKIPFCCLNLKQKLKNSKGLTRSNHMTEGNWGNVVEYRKRRCVEDQIYQNWVCEGYKLLSDMYWTLNVLRIFSTVSLDFIHLTSWYKVRRNPGEVDVRTQQGKIVVLKILTLNRRKNEKTKRINISRWKK